MERLAKVRSASRLRKHFILTIERTIILGFILFKTGWWLVALVSTFPIISSAFAAAASVSKARCEVDAEAACQVSTLAFFNRLGSFCSE